MKALILLADGFEEISAFTVFSILKSAGINASTVSVSSSIVSGSQKARIIADKKIDEIDPYSFDILILPGCQGKNLLNSGRVIDLIKGFDKKNKFIAGIGESPVVLAEAGILDDKIAAVFPGYENRIPRPRSARVVVAKNIITANGPAAAMDFSLKLVELFAGKKAAAAMKKHLVCDGYA